MSVSSALTGVNQNTLGLVNLNIDFSLIKVNAPREFTGLGNALSSGRKKAAEEGDFHRLARVLGGLFEGVAPAPPKLVKAYGTRVSEIAENPWVNPAGSPSDGPFERFVGVDGTSIWAAATSGNSALAILLLACLLARKWDDAKLSTAIWEEIVYERKKEIETICKSGRGEFCTSTLFAYKQTIPRDHIAKFDASIRAWLNSADQAMGAQQTKLMLIVKNVSVSMTSGGTTYRQVLNAWRSAMSGLEGVLHGVLYQVAEGALLVALSAWHLYPDMIILQSLPGPKPIVFDDPLVRSGGTITIGATEYDDDNGGGICWSLTLSHLQYYGEPIRVESRGESAYVTMSQILVIALGALFESWKVPRGSIRTAACLIVAIYDSIQHATQKEEQNSFLKQIPWLELLSGAAREIVSSDSSEKVKCQILDSLLYYGRRRGKRFLGSKNPIIKPFFGLLDLHLHSALQERNEFESGVQYLRQRAGNFASNQLLIMQHWRIGSQEAGRNATVLLTAAPHRCLSGKRDHTGKRKLVSVHARWVLLGLPKEASNQKGHDDQAETVAELHAWKRRCEEKGEIVVLIEQSGSAMLIPSTRLHWHGAPALLLGDGCPTFGGPGNCNCLDVTNPGNIASFSKVFGNSHGLGLWSNTSKADSTSAVGVQRSFIAIQNDTDLDTVRRSLESSPINPHLLRRYLQLATTSKTPDFEPETPEQVNLPFSTDYYRYRLQTWWAGGLFSILVGQDTVSADFTRSLQVLKLASRIYTDAADHQIPLKIIEQPICEADWIPSNVGTDIECVTRSQAFACLAMFESGSLDVNRKDLSRVIALASGNSIFVPSTLLSDPGRQTPEAKMQRIRGSIGHPGISLLFSPRHPRCRPLKQSIDAVEHLQHDGAQLDNFQAMSLHLWFTEGRKPLVMQEDLEFIDQDIYFVQAVVSVRDQSKWVTDIDVLNSNADYFYPSKDASEYCLHDESQRTKITGACAAIDSWDEILELPDEFGIVRAHDNWAARLAAMCLLRQRFPKIRIAIINGDIDCWGCLEEMADSSLTGTEEDVEKRWIAID